MRYIISIVLVLLMTMFAYTGLSFLMKDFANAVSVPLTWNHSTTNCIGETIPQSAIGGYKVWIKRSSEPDASWKVERTTGPDETATLDLPPSNSYDIKLSAFGIDGAECSPLTYSNVVTKVTGEIVIDLTPSGASVNLQ